LAWFEGGHPKASQIGVDFRDPASIGVEFRGFAFPITRDVGVAGDLAYPLPLSFNQDSKALIFGHPKASQIGVGLAFGVGFFWLGASG
jgi:hypothetical protein